jgi:uncharacterized protein
MSTTDSTNVSARTPGDTVREFFAANTRGDVDAVLGLFAPDATWVIPGDVNVVPWVGKRDVSGIADYMSALSANSEMTSFDIVKWLEDGPDVIVVGTFGFKFPSGGQIVDDPFVIHMVVVDGLVRSYIIHEDSLGLARAYAGEDHEAHRS